MSTTYKPEEVALWASGAPEGGKAGSSRELNAKTQLEVRMKTQGWGKGGLLCSAYQPLSASQVTTQASPHSGDLNIIQWTFQGEKKFCGTCSPQIRTEKTMNKYSRWSFGSPYKFSSTYSEVMVQWHCHKRHLAALSYHTPQLSAEEGYLFFLVTMALTGAYAPLPLPDVIRNVTLASISSGKDQSSK